MYISGSVLISAHIFYLLTHRKTLKPFSDICSIVTVISYKMSTWRHVFPGKAIYTGFSHLFLKLVIAYARAKGLKIEFATIILFIFPVENRKQKSLNLGFMYHFFFFFNQMVVSFVDVTKTKIPGLGA